MTQAPLQCEAQPVPPPLLPALAAMTALQAIVALTLFTPGVLAPRLGLDETAVSAFSTAVFATGMATSLFGGMLAARLGPFAVAVLCALCAAAAMLSASVGTWPALVLGGLLLGLAFGPETPASSALLVHLAPVARRPLIFSLRQTGNQIGGIAGSLALPLVAATATPRTGFALVGGLALVAALWFLTLRRRYDPLARARAPVQRPDLRAAITLLGQTPALLRLALASMPFSALQMALNVFFVVYAVETLQQSHIRAGLLLAIAQTGGFVGRLLWGLVATRFASPAVVVSGLGFAMAGFGLLVALAGPDWPFWLLALVLSGLGLTASGWNGVFVAEIARLAPAGHVAEATGAVLTASYLGLVLAPPLIAALAAIGSLAWSYAAISLLVVLALIPLLRRQ